MNRGIVTAELLNIRSYPGSRGIIVDKLSKNSVVNIIDKVFDWYQIRLNNITAYASAKYIQPLVSEINLRARVKSSKLNVRSGPSTGYNIIGQVLQDDTLNIIDDDGDWLEIEFNEQTGYVHSDYVQMLEGGHKQKGIVSASLLNVRKQASAKSDIIGKLHVGAEVQILAETKFWYEIKFNQTTGYVSKRFISKPGSEPPARYFYQKESLKTLPLVPASLFSGGSTREERRVVKTWNNYGNMLQQIADLIDIDVGCAIAVLCVESGGEGVDKNGRAIIRFENHQFWKYWGKYEEDTFNEHFQFDESRRWKGHKFRVNTTDDWQRFHGKQDREWEVLDFARSLDNEAALKSISIGLPQIMGFNYKKIGYPSVQRMFDMLSSGERYQVLALFDFLDNRMISALKSYDFVKFATYYNGSGQAEDYGEWIQNHYDAFTRIKNG